MQIVEIKVGELTDFVAGSLWQNLSPKPLTLLRAISQSTNPRALPGDLALLIAHEENSLIALAGLLPDYIHGEAGQRASSNSCWWANPEKGKHLAVPLFLKAFALCNQRMFMTDCTPHTLSILERTHWFDFPDTEPGIRGFLKFNLHEVIPAKFPANGKLKFLLQPGDAFLNFALIPYRLLKSNRIRKVAPKVEYLTTLNPELCLFIEKHSMNEFTRRSGADLEWIIKNPWIKEKTSSQPIAPAEYPFSHLVDCFSQYFVHISDAGQTIGLLFISIRDGHMKVPYVYFKEDEAERMVKVIYREAIVQKAVTLTVFCPALVSRMSLGPHPFVFRKKVKRLIAISSQLSDLYHLYPVIQDGDGDVVFT